MLLDTQTFFVIPAKAGQSGLALRRERALAMVRREPEWIVPGEVAFITHALVVPSWEEADRADLRRRHGKGGHGSDPCP